MIYKNENFNSLMLNRLLFLTIILGLGYTLYVYGHYLYKPLCWDDKYSLFCSSPEKKEVLSVIENELENQVEVGGGVFHIGDVLGVSALESDKPTIKVKLSDFSISKYEITFGSFVTYLRDEMRSQAYLLNFSDASPTNLGLEYENRISKYYYRKPARAPSWSEARGYCKWLAKKTGFPFDLPTAAQWEYAARSGGKKAYFSVSHFNSNVQVDDYYRNFDVDFEERELRGEYFPPKGELYTSAGEYGNTRVVGSYPPNPLGLYDMSGNLSEWVLDWYDESYYLSLKNDSLSGVPIVDPVNSNSSLIRKEYRDTAAFVGAGVYSLVSSRGSSKPDTNWFGFRCVRNKG